MKNTMKSCVSVSILCISIWAAWASLAPAAEHYVRAGASGAGNGSNWTDAWTQLPAALVRGDTYYIATGVYPPCTFKTAESGATLIKVLKAVESAHGAAPDWDSAYGSGQAVFTGTVGDFSGTIVFSTGYWVFDGVTGAGQGTLEQHGFKLSAQNDAASYLALVNNGADYITISHTEMKHLSMGQLATVVTKTKGLNATGSSNGGSSHLLISYNYIHDVTVTMLHLNYVRESLIEHNFLEHRLGGDYINTSGVQTYIHGEAMSMNYCGLNANNTVRFNTFKDINGTGLVIIKDSVQSHFYVYGNVGFATEDQFVLSNGAVANTVGDTNTYMYVFNNTFADLRGLACGIVWSNGANNYAYNNLMYNCQKVSFSGTGRDYNWFYGCGAQSEPHMESGTQDPFVNRAAGDFRLAAHTAPGTSDLLTSLPAGDSSYYAHDMNGKERVNWDRGAFESSTVTADTQAPSVPQSLTATAVSSTKIGLTWTASTDNVGVAYYKITRNGAAVTTVSLASYQNEGLTPSTAYTYQVTACDQAGNESAQSAGASATTPAATDIEPPTAPASLSATSSGSKEIEISWSASTDNVGVTGYSVYRSSTAGGAYSKVTVSPVAGLTYMDPGLAEGSTYYYIVKAVDAESNESAASPEASATVTDTTPPEKPQNVMAQPLTN